MEEIGTDGHHVYVTFVVVLILCMFSVTLNSILLYCIVAKRKLTWAKKAKQILYQILSDLIVSLFMILRVILEETVSRKTYEFCAVLNFTTVCTQLVSYCHVLSFCVHRYTVIRSAHLPSQLERTRFGIRSLFIWVTVSLASVIPYVLWGQPAEVLVDCRLWYMFGLTQNGPHRGALIYILVSFCAPWILTNVVYMTTAFKILCMTRVSSSNIIRLASFRRTDTANISCTPIEQEIASATQVIANPSTIKVTQNNAEANQHATEANQYATEANQHATEANQHATEANQHATAASVSQVHEVGIHQPEEENPHPTTRAPTSRVTTNQSATSSVEHPFAVTSADEYVANQTAEPASDKQVSINQLATTTMSTNEIAAKQLVVTYSLTPITGASLVKNQLAAITAINDSTPAAPPDTNQTTINGLITPATVLHGTSGPQTSITNQGNMRLVKSIGYLLIAFNISILPLVLVPILILKDNQDSLPEQIQAFVFMNNVCNPLIYMFSFPKLRAEVKHMLRKGLCRFRRV